MLRTHKKPRTASGTRSGPTEDPTEKAKTLFRIVSVICVDASVPERILLDWDVTLDLYQQETKSTSRTLIRGHSAAGVWPHKLDNQVVSCGQSTIPLSTQHKKISLNQFGRHVWVDVPLPEFDCGYDGYLVFRRNRIKDANQVQPVDLTVINYITRKGEDGKTTETPPSRALFIYKEEFRNVQTGVETFHICNLLAREKQLYFLASRAQRAYQGVHVTLNGQSFYVSAEKVIAAEDASYVTVLQNPGLFDRILAFTHELPEGYKENANTAGSPIRKSNLDIIMTQRSRNKIIELRNRFENVSARQRLRHFRRSDLFPLLVCQRDEIGALLNVSTTWLKDRIRAFGVLEWPARALMVHSSELRIALLALQDVLHGPSGVIQKLWRGYNLRSDEIDRVVQLEDAIARYRQQRIAVLQPLVTEDFYKEFLLKADPWCLDPSWDSQPPWNFTLEDHKLKHGFGRLSIPRS